MTPTEDPRTVALDVLVRVEDGAFSNLALPPALRRSGLDARDRAFVTDLVYGTLRMQGHSDYLLGRHLDRPVDRVDPVARAALRMGAYQLEQGIAPHAAVGETVAACARRLPRARGFVNAVLRRLADADDEIPDGDDAESVAIRTSMPPWIVSLAQERFGSDAEHLLASMNSTPRLTLRPNVLRTDAPGVVDALRRSGAEVTQGTVVPGAVCVRGAGDPAALDVVRDGLATPQDEGSQAIVSAVGAQPGERILDIAAAPGGKSTGMAELVGPRGLVVACDIDAGRVARIGDAARRLALAWCHPVVADGTALPFTGRFDRVLLDAPCSGLGVLRRRAEARWRIQPEDVSILAERQRAMLQAAARYVAPGGLLLYSVCTWTPEETDEIARWARTNLDGFVAEPLSEPWKASGQGAVLLPDACDGMYALALRAKPSPNAARDY